MKRPLRRRPVVWFVIVLILAAVALSTTLRHRSPVSHTVTLDAARFEPTVSVVRVGDTVTWVNKDIVPHTATSRTGLFDSGTIESGASWSYVPTRAGEFPYFCAFHPTMVALLRVR